MVRIPRLSATPRRNTRLSALKRQRTAKLTRLATRAALLQRRGRQDEAYTIICDEFVKLGGIYVKFLQGVLLNSPIMRRWRNPNKLKIFENLPQEPIDIVTLLQHHLQPEQLRQIAKLQTTPFAAGSFGQVYYGELQNGQPIVVKALRPQVRELLQHDLRLLSLFTRFFAGRHYRNIDLKLDDAIKDFRRATLAETDYEKEAHFATEMYEASRDKPDLVIPKTYLELCTPQFIVQDYVGGISCAELLEQQTNQGLHPAEQVRERLGSDLQVQLETLGIALLDDCFNQAHVMGDPHPGNVRLLPGNKIGLIDFGICAPAPRNRAAFYGLISEWSHMYLGTLNIANLFEQFLRVFVNDLYRALKKLTRLMPTEKNQQVQQSLLKNVGGIVKELFDGETQTEDLIETMNQGRLLRLFSQVINKGNRLGLTIKMEDSEILRSAQTYMSMVESLGLRNQVFTTVFSTVVREQGKLHPELTGNGDERQVTTSRALEIINSWLERVASKDPVLFRRLLQQVGSPGFGGRTPATAAVTGINQTVVSEKVQSKEEQNA
jgi:hypothetical protein